jgi:hypothetical protein
MHLLRFDSDDFISLVSFEHTDVPQYAILSHTWGVNGEELSYQELKSAVGVNAEGALEGGKTVHRLIKGENRDLPTRKREIERIRGKKGYQKIQFCGKQAAKDNLVYFWVDSCCIDKSNSAELSEAINSMFEWYKKAVKCYVYLQDVSVGPVEGTHIQVQEDIWEEAFRGSRWFTRGWTL